jgi:hypothetical protein
LQVSIRKTQIKNPKKPPKISKKREDNENENPVILFWFMVQQ